MIAVSRRMGNALDLGIDVAFDAAAPARPLIHRRPGFLLGAPLPRRRDPALPDTRPGATRPLLCGLKCAFTEMRIVERPPFLDQLTHEIAAPDRADSELSTSLVRILRFAADRPRS